MKVATYLMFNGKCEEALNFYKELFHAEVTCMIKFSKAMTDNTALIDKVFHAELKIENFYIFMSDTIEKFDYEHQAYKITFECDTLEDAQKYYNALSESGTVIQPLTKMPWGDYISHLRDPYEIT